MKTITTVVKQATDLREFMDPYTTMRRRGLVYFQVLENGGIIARSLSNGTDGEILSRMIKENKIFLPVDCILTEEDVLSKEQLKNQ